MQPDDPAIPGCVFSRLLGGRYGCKQNKIVGKRRVLACSSTLLLLLKPFSAMAFYCSVLMIQLASSKTVSCSADEFDVNTNSTPAFKVG